MRQDVALRAAAVLSIVAAFAFVTAGPAIALPGRDRDRSSESDERWPRSWFDREDEDADDGGDAPAVEGGAATLDVEPQSHFTCTNDSQLPAPVGAQVRARRCSSCSPTARRTGSWSPWTS